MLAPLLSTHWKSCHLNLSYEANLSCLFRPLHPLPPSSPESFPLLFCSKISLFVAHCVQTKSQDDSFWLWLVKVLLRQNTDKCSDLALVFSFSPKEFNTIFDERLNLNKTPVLADLKVSCWHVLTWRVGTGANSFIYLFPRNSIDLNKINRNHIFLTEL